jgi:hypothetical protein
MIARIKNWRVWLLMTHRWMGIVLGIMLVIWTVSGIVLMYYGLPHLHAGERLARLPVLDASSIRVSPAQAATRVEGEPFRMRISMLGDRPVYRINTGRVFGQWALVYADTGDSFEGFDADGALEWLQAPALRVEFDDPQRTWLYMTPSHGQVLKIEARDRANRWAYYDALANDQAA